MRLEPEHKTAAFPQSKSGRFGPLRRSANGMVWPCSGPASKGSWQAAPKTRTKALGVLWAQVLDRGSEEATAWQRRCHRAFANKLASMAWSIWLKVESSRLASFRPRDPTRMLKRLTCRGLREVETTMEDRSSRRMRTLVTRTAQSKA